jgi:phosphate transport system substrate-binding protein
MRTVLALIAITFLSAAGAERQMGNVILIGTGATFPYTLYETWIAEYQSSTGLRITYTPKGSGQGIDQLCRREVDFGGTDAFLTDEELERDSCNVVHIPTCMGAVAITYNLPDNPHLRFTSDILSDIFLGKITQWNDDRIVRVNLAVKLPARAIQVIHRSEASGTNYIFTHYLSSVSKKWQEEIGCGKTVRWSVGMGVEGNPMVAAYVKKIDGAIGYVEHSYALSKNLPTASLKNRSGLFVEPTIETISNAAQVEFPADMRILITDTPVAAGYPISAFTYIIAFKEQNYRGRPIEKGKAVADWLWWIIHNGQSYPASLYYAPLPHEAVAAAEAAIRTMTYAGKPLIEKQ